MLAVFFVFVSIHFCAEYTHFLLLTLFYYVPNFVVTEASDERNRAAGVFSEVRECQRWCNKVWKR